MAQVTYDENQKNVPVGSTEYSKILTWLYKEAQTLDRGEWNTWLAMMDSEISYTMPTRVSVMPRDGNGFSKKSGFFDENIESLKTRVRRLQTTQAWAEQPSSMTRHYVSNVMVQELAGGLYRAELAFMLTRIRGQADYELFTGERIDVFRPHGDELKLLSREILLDQTVLKSFNLSFFF